MNGILVAFAIFVVVILLLTAIGAAFVRRPKRPDYIDPEDRPIYGPDNEA